MTPKRFSIYASQPLKQGLAERLPIDAEQSGRTRSGLIATMAERYAETCRRSMPSLTLNQWLLLFDALNGCWMRDNAALAARSIALEVADACRLNDAHERHGLSLDEGLQLARTLQDLPFAAQMAVLDAAERFWVLDIQPEPDEGAEDAQSGCRAAVRRLVGRLADEE